MSAELMSSVQVLYFSFGVIGVVFLILTLIALIQQRHVQVVHGKDEFYEKKAVVIEELNPEGLVRVQGEIWKACSSTGETISAGSRVRVLHQSEMELLVEPWKMNS